jgi:hypothetical protein
MRKTDQKRYGQMRLEVKDSKLTKKTTKQAV